MASGFNICSSLHWHRNWFGINRKIHPIWCAYRLNLKRKIWGTVMPSPWSDWATDIKICHSKIKIHITQQNVKKYSTMGNLLFSNGFCALVDNSSYSLVESGEYSTWRRLKPRASKTKLSGTRSLLASIPAIQSRLLRPSATHTTAPTKLRTIE